MSSRDGYFEAMYGAATDPYGVRSRWYERRKIAILIASLPRERFGRTYEPACGIGELTAALAERSGSVLASDFNARAAGVAGERAHAAGNVRVQQHRLPQQWPVHEEPFDLIVLSEIGYFLTQSEWQRVCEQAKGSLVQDGVLIGCHWRRPFDQRTLATDFIHTTLGAGLQRLALYQEDDFLIEVWSKDGASVAQREGIV